MRIRKSNGPIFLKLSHIYFSKFDKDHFIDFYMVQYTQPTPWASVFDICLQFHRNLLWSNSLKADSASNIKIIVQHPWEWGDHLQTRGGPKNFTLAKTHILENRGVGGLNPYPPLDQPWAWLACCFFEQDTFTSPKVLVIPRKRWLLPNMSD